jgi:hypothetical protein
MIWHPVEKKLPKLTKEQMRPEAFGVQVLIYPPYKMEGASDAHTAFFGCRYSDKPDFYLYGRGISVTHWMPLPPAPNAAPAFTRGQSVVWKVGREKIPGMVLGYSHSGKRVRLKTKEAGWGRYVSPDSLEAA